MGNRPDARPSQAPPARRRKRSDLFWATLPLIAGGGLLAVGQAVGPVPLRYRLERIDRGPIRSEVTAPGTVFTMTRDLSRVQLRVAVSEADAGRVAVGQAATLRWACPDCVSSGTVSEVRPSPRVGGGAFGYKAQVEADNHDHKLLPGMAAAVSIEVARRDGVLRIPEGALRFVPAGMGAGDPRRRFWRVLVVGHRRARPVRVTLGLQDLGHAELVAGPLREGDAVIVEQE